MKFGEVDSDIALNLNRCKNINEVIDAIAHELAHIVMGSESDNNEHASKWSELKNEMSQRYFSTPQGGVGVE